MITVSSRLAGGIGPNCTKDGLDGLVGADHPPLSVISAKLWPLPAEKAVQKAWGAPAEQARRGPPRARAERAFAPLAVMLVRQAIVATPALHGTVRPYAHGTSLRRCRHHEVSVTPTRPDVHMFLT